MTFRKIWSYRHLFDSKISIHSLKGVSEESPLLLKNNSDSSRAQELALGEHIPFGAYDLEVMTWSPGVKTGMVWAKNEQNQIRLTCVNGEDGDRELILEVFAGGEKVLARPIKNAKLTPPFTLRADFTPESIGDNVRRCFLSIWEERAGNPTLLEHKIDIRTDFSSPAIVAQYKASLYSELPPQGELTINRMESYITGGAAQADPKPLHDETGKILQEGDTIWLGMSVRGYDIHSSYQGVYSYNLKTGELQIKGLLLFNLNGRGHYASFHASDIIYNRMKKEWIVMPTAHNERPHAVKSGLIPKDPRVTPFQFVDVTDVKYPNQSNEEDASLIYDKSVKKWRLVMCDSGKGGYQIPLLESSSWNGEYKEIARYDQAPCTGIQIQQVDGTYYVFFGRNVDNCEVLEYPSMTQPTKLNIQSSPRSYNVWPVIIPFYDKAAGKTRYYLLSFDRATHGGNHSYGNIYLYEAMEYPGMSSSEPRHIAQASSAAPVEIRTVEQFLQIHHNLDKHYILKNNLDLSKIKNWVPIGTPDKPFTGTFDGGGHSIKGLTIRRPNSNHTGLFGYVGKETELKNISITQAKIEGNIYVGTLAGYNEGSVSNCSADGQIKASSAGGILIGQNTGVIRSSATKGAITSSQGDGIGGLVGVNCGNIGEIDLERKGLIISCSSSAQVTAPINAGGLVGYNDCGSVSQSTASGKVSGKNCIGGLIGNSGRNYANKSDAPVLQCSATGPVTGEYSIGGLIGMNDGRLENCLSSGSVTGQRHVGGLIGTNNSQAFVRSCNTSSSVKGMSHTGTLLGWNRGQFEKSISSIKGKEIGNAPMPALNKKN